MTFKIPTLDSVKNIDLKDTKTITILVILCIVLFAIIYVWTNKKNTTEGFGQYNINSGDLVSLYGLDNIVVGNSNPLSLTSTINTLIDARNAGTLSNTYAKTSDLANTNMNLTSNAISLLSTISALNNLQTTLTTDLQLINQIVTSNVAIMNNNLTSNVATMNTVMGNTPPPFTIVAIFTKNIPYGWQLCDGNPFMAMDSQQVHIMQNNAITPINTPNLLGKTVIGATPQEWMTKASTGITQREINISGGEETHILTIGEMPAHHHNMYRDGSYTGGDNTGGLRDGNFFGLGSSGNQGENIPHNNMQPFLTIPYIIKRPLVGGSISSNVYNIYTFNPNYLLATS